MQTGSLERAAEAATRVNALLAAKGLVKPDAVTSKAKLLDTGVYSAEFVINDLPEACRTVLLLEETRNEITRLTNASVTVHGRFVTKEQRNNVGCIPLSLHIDGPTQFSVEGALRKINQVIASTSVGRAPTGTARSSSSSASTDRVVAPRLTGSYVQEKVYIGLDSAPSEFELRARVLGPSRMYLKHIQTETNATVVLRGRGSGTIEPESGREAYEPLHIYLAHANVSGLARAKELALNLIQTVHNEHRTWLDRSTACSTSQPLASAVREDPPLRTVEAPQTQSAAEPDAYVSPATTDYLKRFNLRSVPSTEEKSKNWPSDETTSRPSPSGFFPEYSPRYPPPFQPSDQFRFAHSLRSSNSQSAEGESRTNRLRPTNEPPLSTAAVVLYPIGAIAHSTAVSSSTAPRLNDAYAQLPANSQSTFSESRDDNSTVLLNQPKVHATTCVSSLSNAPQSSQAETAESGRRKLRRFVEAKSDLETTGTSCPSGTNQPVAPTETMQPAITQPTDADKLQKEAATTFAKPASFARPLAPVKRTLEEFKAPSMQKVSRVETQPSASETTSPEVHNSPAPLSSAFKILNAYADSDSDSDT